MLAFMLLLTGVFSLGWTAFASGAPNDSSTYVVRAKIPAELLTEGATIDKPSDQQRFTEQDITAEGTCPDDSYVTLTRNNVYAGTTMCNSNRWAIDVSLVLSANELTPQAYNITDDAGPTTTSRTVYYSLPQPPSDPTTPIVTPVDGASPTKTTSSKPAVPPLVLTGQFRYLGVKTGDQLVQSFSISGGQAPYAISIDWGDGSRDVVSRAKAGDFMVSHVYSTAGNQSHNSYIIRLTASDNQDQKTSLQTMAIVTNQPGVIGATRSGQNGLFTTNPGSRFGAFWRVAGPVYAIGFVALASFWLGERRELEVLRRVPMSRHKHRHA